LLDAIVHAGNIVFATIDQAAAAAKAGLTLRSTLLIVFGNPKGGTMLMQAFPLVALELPLKFVIWEEGGFVRVAYVPASALAARYDVSAKESLIAAMDEMLASLSDSVT